MNNERLHLLIVEDEAAHVEAIRRAFEQAGSKAEIIAVGTLLECWEHVGAHLPDLVLIDLNLPDGRAMEILSIPKEDVLFPILVMTAFGSQQIAVEVMKLGALDYVVKSPEAFAAMPQTVERALREWRLIQKYKQEEAEMTRAREHYQRLLEIASDGIHILDQEGTIIEASPSFYQMLGYSPENPPRLNVKDWDAQWSPGQLKERRANVIKQPGIFETRHRRQDGQVIDVEINAHGTMVDGQQYLYASSRDITERKRAEASHRRLVTAVEQTAETIVITDIQGTIVYANPALEKTSGYSCAEAIGKNPRMFKSGRQDAAFYGQMWKTLTCGDTWKGHLINRRKDGAIYEEEVIISPVRNAANAVVNYVAVERDVTHEMQLDAQLRQAQKMEAVGHLAGGVAHDFNNILAAILMRIGLLQEEGGLTESVRDALIEMDGEANRAAALTRQLLAFSRRQILQLKAVNLDVLVDNLSKMLRRLLGEQVTLHWNSESALPSLKADEGMVEQIITNLCINARDAMPQGGCITIDAKSVIFEENVARNHPERRPGSFVRLSVSDTGCGMDEEVQKHIFEPFFSTKGVGRGTGLGLSTVYGIVKQHGGWIELESTVGKGSAFHVYFPSIASDKVVNNRDEAKPVVGGKGETILVVEDELSVRRLVCITLKLRGYRILQASNGLEALDLWKQHRATIDLLLTDVVMPGGITGYELAEVMRKEKQELKVILTTGYSDTLIAMNTKGKLPYFLLAKPYAKAVLLAAIRDTIDQPGA
jgi:PAS domain S-box-containing protein